MIRILKGEHFWKSKSLTIAFLGFSGSFMTPGAFNCWFGVFFIVGVFRSTRSGSSLSTDGFISFYSQGEIVSSTEIVILMLSTPYSFWTDVGSGVSGVDMMITPGDSVLIRQGLSMVEYLRPLDPTLKATISNPVRIWILSNGTHGSFLSSI